MPTLAEYKQHVRDRAYMSGIDRDHERIKQNGEVFTPTLLVQSMLDMLEEQSPNIFQNCNQIFLDNSCGDGQFLSEVIIRKAERARCTLVQALSTTYGVDLMEDNVKECRARLAGPNPSDEVLAIVNKNIVCHDALTYDYSFV